MKLYTLGTSHGATEKGRACSCNLITVNGASYLFDCGGNTEGKMTDMGLDISSIRAAFISHMHEDHAGSLSAIVKRFAHYIPEKKTLKMFLPEQNGIDAFKNWLIALHADLSRNDFQFILTKAGEIYRDENITVTAIPTKHIENGKFESFAFDIKAGDKRFLYTGDLAPSFCDYPQVLLEEEFDTVLCELVHFNVEKNLPMICKTKTRRLVFTHMGLHNIPIINNVLDKFPFEVCIAHDGAEFEI